MEMMLCYDCGCQISNLKEPCPYCRPAKKRQFVPSDITPKPYADWKRSLRRSTSLAALPAVVIAAIVVLMTESAGPFLTVLAKSYAICFIILFIALRKRHKVSPSKPPLVHRAAIK